MAPHTFSLEKPISAIASSPDGELVAVVGRDVLKVIKWNEKDSSLDDPEQSKEHWEVVKNFRVGRLNLNYSSVDVQWNPMFPQFIGTAATNGAIVIWNVSRDGKKQERVIKEHNRTVNRIGWHPSDGNVLLSASQDGSVKMFDLRNPNPVQTFSASNSEVRDVQFHPFHSNYFASANDNGTIQLWDVRKVDRDAMRQVITAHQGLILAIDWHPSTKYDNLIASAGRDRLVKVWDLKSQEGNVGASHIVQTIASVGRVKWRPSFPTQLCSTHSVVDSRVHVWDTKHPNIPLYSLQSHTDVVTGLVFDRTDPQCNTVITGSKDGTIKRFHIKSDSYKHFDHIPTTAVHWTPTNKLSYTYESVERPSTRPHWMSTSVTNLKYESAKYESSPGDPYNLFATQSKSSVARSVQTIQAPQTHESAQDPIYQTFDPVIFERLAREYRFTGAPLAQLCDHNHHVATAANQIEIAQLWIVLKLCFLADLQDKSNKKSEDDWNFRTDSIFDEPCDLSFLSETLGGGRRDDALIGDYSKLEQEPHHILDPEGLCESVFSFTSSRQAFFNPQMKSREDNEVPSITIPDFDFSESIEAMLDFHAERGDVQTCATVILVLGSQFSTRNANAANWIHSYIELLYLFQLYTVANHVIKECDIPEIRVRNQKGTTIQIGCSVCGKTLLNKAWRCEKCKNVKGCAICSQPVKGLYVWCQACGHGGHLAHIKDWFKDHKICSVAGCGHTCAIPALSNRR